MLPLWMIYDFLYSDTDTESLTDPMLVCSYQQDMQCTRYYLLPPNQGIQTELGYREYCKVCIWVDLIEQHPLFKSLKLPKFHVLESLILNFCKFSSDERVKYWNLSVNTVTQNLDLIKAPCYKLLSWSLNMIMTYRLANSGQWWKQLYI